MADWLVVLVSNLKEYLGLLFSSLVVNLRPPGPLFTVLVVTAEPGEVGRLSLAISELGEYLVLSGAANF